MRNLHTSEFFTQLKQFIDYPNIVKVISNNPEIYYVNDGILEICICFQGKNIYPFIQNIIDIIPLYHYFFDLTGEWCLGITADGYIDFGFSA